MNFFNRIFKKNEKKGINPENENHLSFLNEYDKLLENDAFLSRSEFKCLLAYYKNDYEQFYTLESTKTLKNYCKKNGIDIDKIKAFLIKYNDLRDNKSGYKLIALHNEAFIKKHIECDREYFENILKKVDPNIKLDEEQIRVCLDDEDYSLVIAGAGAGKTTTIAAKVRYLIEKKNINPADILIISFTNKAVNELKEKIVKCLGYKVPISTFHSCGRAIVKKDVNYAESNILSDNYFFIKDYVNNLVLYDNNLLSEMVMLFAYYLDFNEDIISNISLEEHFNVIEKNHYTSLKSEIINFNNQEISKNAKGGYTILNERLKSYEEVQIANFLFMNGIEYEYEKVYNYPIPNANKLYTPDFFIKQGDLECYIEHFGITEDYKNNRYNQEQLATYVTNMKYKINHHCIHNTNLIITFSKYNDNLPLLEHLEKELINKGFNLIKKSDEEIYNAIKMNKDNNYMFKFNRIASRFISLFKTRNYSIEDFEILRRKTNNPRNLLFLNIMEKVYIAYELYLKEHRLVDFEDMINESARLLKEVKAVRDKINFKYVLIDEYQDISRARLNLVNEIKNATNAKIIVVGDDWQAIYGYAGSEINLFTKFVDQMGYASILKITRTYRNAQELIDIAGSFVQKNDLQIKKVLISNKNIDKAINIYTYDGSYKSIKNEGTDVNKARLLEKVIKLLIKLDGAKQNILIIGRYNFDGQKLLDSGLFYTRGNKNNVLHSTKYPDVKLTFMTAHATKGLTYDNVIIINAINSKFGFPAQIDDDPIFNFVRTNDDSYDFSEERRLFYVALTRTKNRVFILTPYQRPSSFVLELLADYKDKINLQDSDFPIRREIKLVKSDRIKCPICGYPLQLQKNNAYGLRLFICTNEPEVCDYMTNNLVSGTRGIHLCNKCGGVMFVKPRKDKSGYFFGCSNYKTDGSGCLNTKKIDN